MSMQPNTNTNARPDHDTNAPLQELLAEVADIQAQIDETARAANAQLDVIASQVDASAAKVESLYAELDTIEREAGDEWDRFILQRAEALAEE